MKTIEASNLRKTYRGGVPALDGLSFDVEAGTIFGTARPERGGEVDDREDPDHALARGQRRGARGRPRRRPRRRPGAPLDRSRRAEAGPRPGRDRPREPRDAGRDLRRLRRRTARARVAELLERFGLAEAGGRLAKTYSGGMQRRLDVALGLVHRPQVLFLDEPTTGLDPEVRAELWQEIERLAREEEMTILLTTHYLEEADRLAAELVIVDRGRVVAQGSPDDTEAGAARRHRAGRARRSEQRRRGCGRPAAFRASASSASTGGSCARASTTAPRRSRR